MGDHLCHRPAAAGPLTIDPQVSKSWAWAPQVLATAQNGSATALTGRCWTVAGPAAIARAGHLVDEQPRPVELPVAEPVDDAPAQGPLL